MTARAIEGVVSSIEVVAEGIRLLQRGAKREEGVGRRT